MNEQRRLRDRLTTLAHDFEPTVLATLIKTEGSTYRKAGAAMLIPESAAPIGMLSGGCLEAEIVKAARAALARGRSELLTFDLMRDDEALLGYGKGCRGRLLILLEPLFQDSSRLRFLCDLAARPRSHAVAMVYAAEGSAPPIATSFVLCADRSTYASTELNDLSKHRLTDDLTMTLDTSAAGDHEVVTRDGAFRYATFAVHAPITLSVFGAGPDALPLCRMASELDWSVRVYDHRPGYLDVGRFSRGVELHVLNPDDPYAKPADDAWAHAALVMTHNLQVDMAMLRCLQHRSDVHYVGLLGPAQRRDRILRWLAEDEEGAPSRLAGRLHAPVGLDLGGEGEADVALAALAEIQSCLRSGSGRHRREVARLASTHAVILAAGCSSRLGRNKQLLRIGDESLVRRAVRAALTAGVAQVHVVVGFEADAVARELDGLACSLVHNARWAEGPGSSLKAGVVAAERSNGKLTGCLVVLPDQVLVTPEHLHALVAAVDEYGKTLVATGYADAFGAPAWIGSPHFADVLQLPDHAGAKALFTRLFDATCIVPEPNAAVDVDTEADWRNVTFGSHLGASRGEGHAQPGQNHEL